MGESPKAEISVYSPELESFSVETPGGRIHTRWDNEASATPNAQLAFFAEFLATAGLYESWVNSWERRVCQGKAHRSSVIFERPDPALGVPQCPRVSAQRQHQSF
jgi:hypothetical protein